MLSEWAVARPTRRLALAFLALFVACDDGPAGDARDAGAPPGNAQFADAALGPDAEKVDAARERDAQAGDAARHDAEPPPPDSVVDAGAADAAPALPSGNVLVVIADDLGAEAFPCLDVGAEVAEMPFVRALCDRGVVFSEAWVNPVCTPTRAAVLTGRYGFRTGVRGLTTQGGPAIDPGEWTIPRALDRDVPGVRHANIGKWHLSGRRMGLPDPDPLDLGWGHYAGVVEGALEDYFDWPRYAGGRTERVREYATSRTVDDAIEWLGDGAGPWVLWLAFNAPHTPFHVPPAELHRRDLPGTPEDIEANPRPYFLAAAEALDAELGRLLGALDEATRSRTHVVFLGDNGSPPRVTADPVPRRRAKGTLYQGGVRVPLVIAGPSVVAGGRTVDAPVSAVDLYATVVELAGGDPTPPVGAPEVDGRSLLPTLRDPAAAPVRTLAYTEHFAPDVAPDVSGRAIRDQRYKLIELSNGTLALYDLAADPWEAHDLLTSPTPESEAARDRLREAMEAL